MMQPLRPTKPTPARRAQARSSTGAVSTIGLASAEDQASDRAHRLGQTRPVTIYRLIARESVEEKVVCLHGHKRKMAYDLLAGSNQALPLDQAQLQELLS